MAAVLAWFGWHAVSELRVAQARSRQKRSMAEMRDAGQRMMQGQPVAPFEDRWGTPVRIRAAGPHRSLRSAGADREFETGEPRGMTSQEHEPGADIVWIDESFVQFPDGISTIGDERKVTPDPTTRPCAACHPAGVHPRLPGATDS